MMEIEFKLNVTPDECADLIALTAERGLTPEILVDRFLKGAIAIHNGSGRNRLNEIIMNTIESIGDRGSFMHICTAVISVCLKMPVVLQRMSCTEYGYGTAAQIEGQ